MPVSNVSSPAATTKLGSISNVRKPGSAEAAPLDPISAPPVVLDSTPGKTSGSDTPGLSARELLVRGTKPFDRHTSHGGLESILGIDERVQILDVEGNPWRMIVSLEIQTSQGAWVGTGWFAGPKTVITAGHCVHGVAMGGWANKIVLRPGRNGAAEPFSRLESAHFATTDRWFHHQDSEFDYGVIHLGDDALAVTAKTGWFSTAVIDDAGLLAQRVNVAGYPGDKDGGSTQWHHAKQIVRVTPNTVYYDVDTVGGQSGAPAWLDTDQGPRVVGIHAYGASHIGHGVEANSAPRINQAVLDTIKGWLAT